MTEIIERLLNELEVECLLAERDRAWEKLRAEIAEWKQRAESGEKGEPFFLAPEPKGDNNETFGDK